MAWNGFSIRKRRVMPDGLWMRCDGCKGMVYKKIVEEKLNVCPECNFHFTINAHKRIEITIDKDSFIEYFTDMGPSDPLNFRDRKSYKERLAKEQEKTGLKDAAVVGKGKIKGIEVVFGVTDSSFIMGSMGSVVGEKVTRAIEMATEEKLPLILVSGSGGGARMHEGVISLEQMAKTSAALAKLNEAGGLFISLLTNPTMGGVAASFASLGDVVMAEPRALIGFAGPRTIWHTIKVELPGGFQRSEFLLEHGFLDMIVDRKDTRQLLYNLIDYLYGKPEKKLDDNAKKKLNTRGKKK